MAVVFNKMITYTIGKLDISDQTKVIQKVKCRILQDYYYLYLHQNMHLCSYSYIFSLAITGCILAKIC